MIGAVLTRLVFAIAAVSALLASGGVGAPPHQVEPGTPLFHSLVLGAYRFGFLLDPVVDSQLLSPQMAALHRALAIAGLPVTNMPGMEAEPAGAGGGPLIAAATSDPIQELAIAFALLVVLATRLARPPRRPIAELAPRPISAPQWQPLLPLTPPRALLAAASI